MDLNERMKGIENAIMALPEEELTHFIINVVKKVQKRRLETGTKLKAEIQNIGDQYEILGKFISTEMVMA